MSLSKMSKALSLAKVAHSSMLRPMSSIASSSFKECLLNTPSTDVTVLANVDLIEPLYGDCRDSPLPRLLKLLAHRSLADDGVVVFAEVPGVGTQEIERERGVILR